MLAEAVKKHEDATERVRPFANGSQFADWESRNCRRCKKRYDFEMNTFHCDLDAMLTVASVDDGSIPTAEAERMGFDGDVLLYTWDCPERELEDA